MKKNFFLKLIAFSLSAFLLFTACLDSSGNSNSGYANGVVRYDSEKSKMLLDVVIGGITPVSFYSPVFDKMKPGDCCSVNYYVDFKNAENVESVVKITGYYVVDITNKIDFDKQTFDGVNVDLETLLEKEIPIIDPNVKESGISSPYIKGHLFLYHLINQPTDQNTKWSLSYNIDKLSEETVGGVVYDLYLRATIDKEGAKSEAKVLARNAYYIEEYIKMVEAIEKEKGNRSFLLRLNFVKEIKEGKPTWDKTEGFNFLISDAL